MEEADKKKSKRDIYKRINRRGSNINWKRIDADENTQSARNILLFEAACDQKRKENMQKAHHRRCELLDCSFILLINLKYLIAHS